MHGHFFECETTIQRLCFKENKFIPENRYFLSEHPILTLELNKPNHIYINSNEKLRLFLYTMSDLETVKLNSLLV